MKGIPIYNVQMKRFLTEDEACSYVGMSKMEFRRECPVAPRERAQNRKVWDVELLDKWQDGDSSKASHVAEAISRL